MGADKAVGFALQAQSLGHNEMAMVFWGKAYFLTFGRLPENSAVVGTTEPAVREVKVEVRMPAFPDHLQPGRIDPMQPVDSERGEELLLRDANFWMQPKRDGKKFLLFATSTTAIAQTRSMNVVPVPSSEMTQRLIEVAKVFGPFILEAEVYYHSFDGREHRTGAQALTWNQKFSNGQAPVIHCAPFSCLFANGGDMTTLDPQGYRIDQALRLSNLLIDEDAKRGGLWIFEALETARTYQAKKELLERQKFLGKEGVVCSHLGMKYHAGKTGQEFIRIKFLMESTVRIVDLQPTTAAGKLFGAIEIVSDAGEKLGKVGTGFSREDEQKISDAFRANPTACWIEIAHQGYTENHQVWHARYRGLQ